MHVALSFKRSAWAGGARDAMGSAYSLHRAPADEAAGHRRIRSGADPTEDLEVELGRVARLLLEIERELRRRPGQVDLANRLYDIVDEIHEVLIDIDYR